MAPHQIYFQILMNAQVVHAQTAGLAVTRFLSTLAHVQLVLLEHTVQQVSLHIVFYAICYLNSVYCQLQRPESASRTVLFKNWSSTLWVSLCNARGRVSLHET